MIFECHPSACCWCGGHQGSTCSTCRAIAKFLVWGCRLSLHIISSCVLCAICCILQIQMAKIWGCFSTPKHPLVYGLDMSVEWVVLFYPVVLEVLQELVSTVKRWSFTLQPLPSHPSQMSKNNFFLDEMGHLHFVLDEMGLDKIGD